MALKPINQIIEIIQSAIGHIKPSSNVFSAGFENVDSLLEVINEDLSELRQGKLDKLQSFYYHFLPTSTFQELSISNNWEKEYMILAHQFDQLYRQFKNLESDGNPG